MDKNRLEAFSDGVLAVIITIMVLELKAPPTSDWSGIVAILPTFFSYVLSFIYVGIYWSNHHHLFQAAEKVNGGVMWANLHLLFWLSLTPFATAWSAEHHFAALPVAFYGFILFMAAVAYYILVLSLLALHGKHSRLAHALGRDFKGKISMFIYAVAIVTTCYQPLVACALYALVACIWIVPDRRIEKTLPKH